MKQTTSQIKVNENFWKKHKILIFSIISACLITSLIFLYIRNDNNTNLKPSDLEISNDDENSFITTPTKSINEYSDKENLYVIAGKLKQSTHFISTVKGKVSALGGIYTQTVCNDKMKIDNEFYIQTKSTSSFVSVGKQTYIVGNDIVMRDADNVSNDKWSEDFTKTNPKDYKQTYGVLPTCLSNYILNDDTIMKTSHTLNADGTITFSFSIDPEKGTSGYKLNMYKFGDLSSLPIFKSCKLEITVDLNWQIKTINSKDSYTINKGGLLNNLSCTSNLTETFSYPDKSTMKIPNKELFEKFLKN